jgi:hypothetical protein
MMPFQAVDLILPRVDRAMSDNRGSHTHTAQNEGASNVVYEWTTRIHAKKYELGGSFSVLIFLGEVSKDDPSTWHTSPAFVGSHHILVSGMDNPQGDRADSVSEGFVHLNTVIAKRSGLSSFEPSGVVPYLKENLNWRIEAVRVFRFVSCRGLAILDTISTLF